MEWIQFLIFIISLYSLFVWNRREVKRDLQYMDSKIDSNRDLIRDIHVQIMTMVQTIDKETKAMIEGIEKEMKDFHYTLIELQKKNYENKKDS